MRAELTELINCAFHFEKWLEFIMEMNIISFFASFQFVFLKQKIKYPMQSVESQVQKTKNICMARHRKW